MYEYSRRNKLGLGSILLIILFIFTIISLAVLFFVNKGKFWDILPIASIIIIILSLIFAIFNMARRADGGFIFILFFIIFLAGLVMSSIFGPFALTRTAQKAADSGDYADAINNYNKIINNFSTSRYYENSLKEITLAYQKINDYENTIKYVNLSIEQNILDKNSLDVKNILGEAYAKIAQGAYDEKNYEKATVNFVLALNTFKEIAKEFPDSDEAFILSYKIPDYLFKAASSHIYTGGYSQGIELLNEIIEQYPESELVFKAKKLIFDSYMKEITGLIAAGSYQEALEEYMLAQNIAVKSAIGISVNVYNERIYSKIPPEVLSEYAVALTIEKKYEEALSVFDYILLNYPDNTDKVIKYYTTCKTEMIKQEGFLPLPEIFFNFNIKDEDNFLLEITNKSESFINIYFSGNIGNTYKINPKTKANIVIAAGSYKIAAEYEDNLEIKYYGEFVFEAGKKYSQLFTAIDQ